MKKKPPELIKTTLRLPRKVWDDARIEAIRQHKTLQQFLTDVLTAATRKGGN